VTDSQRRDTDLNRTNAELTTGVTRLARELGADLVGVALADAFEGAPAGHHPRNLLRGARSVVVLGVHLLDGAFELAPSRQYSITDRKPGARPHRIPRGEASAGLRSARFAGAGIAAL